jgi:hypothetical protein
MKTSNPVVTVVDHNSKTVATIKNVKTIKGAFTAMRKSSIAFQAGWVIRVESIIEAKGE